MFTFDAKPVARKLVLASLLAACSSLSLAAQIAWHTYNGDALPSAGAAVALPTGSAAAFSEVNDTKGYLSAAGGALKVDSSPAAAAAYARYKIANTSGYPKHLTLVARVLGNPAQRAMDLDIALADAGAPGARVKTVVATPGDVGVLVENWDGTVDNNVDDKTVDTKGARIYQVAVTLTSPTTGSFSVYVDGAKTPIISKRDVALRKTVAAGDNYVSFGAYSTRNTYSGSLDWAVWTTEGAFAPDQLVGKLPAGLGTTTGY